MKFLFLSIFIIFNLNIDNQVRHQGWSISLYSPMGGLAYIEHLGLLQEFSTISFTPSFRALDGETGLAFLIFKILFLSLKN